MAADAATWIRFVPTAHWYGTQLDGITFVAWDQTTGVAGTTGDTTAAGHSVAFSTASETASLTVSRFNLLPALAVLTASPEPAAPHADVTLAAAGVVDPDGDGVLSVTFYRESNGTSGLQTGSGGDTLLAADMQGAAGWSVTVATAALEAGYYCYYAQSADNDGALGPDGDAAALIWHTHGLTGSLDADGNGTADALTNGILILRYLFDPEGQWNFKDALGVGAMPTTRATIRSYLNQYNPGLSSNTISSELGGLDAETVDGLFERGEDWLLCG